MLYRSLKLSLTVIIITLKWEKGEKKKKKKLISIKEHQVFP